MNIKDFYSFAVGIVLTLNVVGGGGNVHAALFAPPPPSGLILTVVSDSEISLSWTDNSVGEWGFTVERAEEDPGGPYTSFPVGADVTTFDDSNLNDNTTYYYRVSSWDLSGSSTYTTANATTDLAPPDAPGGLAVVGATINSLDLSWSDLSDSETGFLIERSIEGGPFGPAGSTGEDVSVFTDTGLDDDTEYTYRVRATNDAGPSGPSNEASGTTDLAPPDAPGGLAVVGATINSLDLSWSDLSDSETGFLIERSIEGGPFGPAGSTGEGVSVFTDTGLDDDTEYTYRVRATNDAGPSGPSNEASGTTDLALPADPSNLMLGSVTSSSIHLTWNDNSHNESGFQVERSGTYNGIYLLVHTTPVDTNYYTNVGLNDNTPYFYRVRAVNATGPSDYTARVGATTQLAPPAAPSGLILSDITERSIRLTWSDNSHNETGFEIERSLTLGGPFEWIYTNAAGVFTYNNINLDENTEYFYRVRAINGAGESGYTEEIGATTLLLAPEAPSDFALSNETVNSIDLSWTDNSDLEDGFEIERSLEESDGFALVYTTVPDAVSYTDPDLMDDTEYFYRIRAFNATGPSPYTAVLSTSTLLDLPGIPDRLNATATNTCTVNLTWRDRSHNESRFELWRSLVSGTGYSMVDTISMNLEAYTDTTTENNRTYYYRIRAVNATGYSEFSDVESVNIAYTLDGGIIVANQAICPAGDPEPLINIVAPSGANNIWTYQWQSLVVPGIYEDIEDATGLNYDPLAGIMETTQYRRVSTTECGVAMSNELTITVEDLLPPTFTYCPNDTLVLIERNESNGTVVPFFPLIEDDCELALVTWSLSGATTGNSPATGINLLGEYTFNMGITTVSYYTEDISGNPASCSFYVTVERKKPEIKRVSIPDVPMKIGDIVSATITVSNDGGTPYSLISGSVAGFPLYNPKPFFHRSNDTTYMANFNILEGGVSYLDIEDIPVTNLIVSDGIDYSPAYNLPIVQGNDPLDAAAPQIFSMSVLPGVKKIGDLVQLNIFADGLNYEIHPASLVNGIMFEGSAMVFTELGGGSYSLSFIVALGDPDVAAGAFTASIVLVKPSGNINIPYETVLNIDNLVIDAHPPQVTRLEVPDESVGIGGVVQVTITADGEGYVAGPGTVINGIPLGSSRVTFADRTGGLYELSYTVAEGDNPVSPGELEMSMVIQDPAGNPSEPFGTIVTNSLEIYTDPPLAILGGTSEICEGTQASLTVFLTGRGPFSFDLSDGDETTTYSDVSDIEYVVLVSPVVTTTYRVTSVTDVNGVINTRSSNALKVNVNQATDVEIINLATGYSVEADPVKLEANVPGGVFSGPGVISAEDKFNPGLADTVNSPHTIVYTYENTNGCISTDSAEVFVLGADGILDIPGPVFCVNGDIFEIRASNIAGDIGTFTLKNSLGAEVPGLTDHGDNTAEVDPSQLDPGEYEVEYRYVDGVVLYLRKNFQIEQIAEPFILNLEEGSYCQSITPFKLQANVPNVIFEGPGVTGDMLEGFIFNPSEVEPGPIEIACTAVSANGCEAKTSKIISILFAPDVDFTLSTSCLPEEGGDIAFENLTTGKLLVESWNWNFGDPASGQENTSTLLEPEHFYSDPGEKTISLTATTFDGCAATRSLDTVVGNQPIADFNWLSDCFANGSGVTFINRTTSESVDLDALVWTFMTESGGVMGEIATDGSTDTVNYPFMSINTYLVELYARNASGCSDTVRKEIELRPNIILGNDEYLEDFNGSQADWSIHSQNDVASWSWDEPDFDGFVPTQGDKAWFTELPVQVLYEEQSWIQSPCYDFSDVKRPLIKLDIMKSFVPYTNGAVLQYMDVMAEGWKTVGETTPGINWYNVTNIFNKPGDSYVGWSLESFDDPDSEWVTAVHELDQVVGKPNVTFRIAFATSEGQSLGNQGFAFDNLVIGGRNKLAVLEYFTNASAAASLAADDFVDGFSAANAGDVIDLQYHMDIPGFDPMYENSSDPPDNRKLNYGIPKAPYAILEGRKDESDFRYDFSELKNTPVIDHIKQVSLEIPLFDVDLSVEWLDESLEATVEVTCNTDKYDEYIDLYLIVIETEVTAYTGGNGDTNFRNVVLDMLPSVSGKLLGNNWTRGENDIRTYSWPHALYLEDAEDLAVVAFVKDRITWRILQADVKYADGTVGTVENHLELTDLLIYPNPVKNSFFVNLGYIPENNSQYRVLDMSGKVLMNGVVPPGYQIHQINIEHLDAGLYILNWTESGLTRGLGKIIKAK